MRLGTANISGQREAVGVAVKGSEVVCLRRADPSIPSSLLEILEGGEEVLNRVRRALDEPPGEALAGKADETPLDAPLRGSQKVLAIGLNYRAHAAELEMPLPQRPIVFPKFPNTIVGPGAPVQLPRASAQLDWEGELCVVIGRRGRHITADRALEHVAGYMNANDISVRDWQMHAATWSMGKNFDTHAPIGPWLVSRDEVPDPAALTLRTWVNGAIKQESGTDDLIFDVPTLIEYISTAMTLEPGDLILTGTPSGVGMGREPQEWLKAGDIVRVEIAGLGSLENPVVAE